MSFNLRRFSKRALVLGASMILVGTCALVGGIAAQGSASAAAAIQSYSATVTIPVPPASSYAGSGGGDGWGLAFTDTAVYNVFHHDSSLIVACHLQSDASPCWSPEVITDGSGNGYASSGQPGLWMDQRTGKLYTYATRNDSTGGVVCIDTTIATTTSDPFCGFTQLTAVGEASLGVGWSTMSAPALIGSHWYGVNFVNNSGVQGSKNTVLCFDVQALAPCANQPFSLGVGNGVVATGAPTTAAAIGSRLIAPITVGGITELACFDSVTGAPCAGSWPRPLGNGYGVGAPFPLLSPTGVIQGVCVPSGIDECFDLGGIATSTPAGMTSAISRSDGWNGPAFVLGPRVYLANGNTNQVECFDAATAATCVNFPKQMSSDYIYTVNGDPQRPTCIWVNSDNGSDQIRNLDAYTGGACGHGPLRVLASTVVLDTQACAPTSYTSLQVLDPVRTGYTSGSVGFQDGDGTSIVGLTDKPLDATGSLDLTPYNLSTSVGLPQFLVTLVGAQAATASVTVKLTWAGTGDSSCVIPVDGPGTTTTSTSLSGGGQSSPSIIVPSNTPVTDQAVLAGPNAGTATGTITYGVYSDASCATQVSLGTAKQFSNGVVPASDAVRLTTPGTYYWQAMYSGDVWNGASTSPCGSEIETVAAASVEPPNLSAVIQISTSAIYDGSRVVVSSPELQAACAAVSFETLQGGTPAAPTVGGGSLPVVVDADGNVTVVVDGIGCIPGRYTVLSAIPAFGVNASTVISVNPPQITFPYRFAGYPANEVETGNTTASGHSDVYTVFIISTSPAYAEDTATISAASLANHCKAGTRWESNGTGSPFVNSTTATATIDNDGNASFVFKGASCAGGKNKVTLTVATGGKRNPKYSTSYVIVPPAITYSGPQPGMTMNVNPTPLMLIGG